MIAFSAAVFAAGFYLPSHRIRPAGKAKNTVQNAAELNLTPHFAGNIILAGPKR
jgi:hypothetical protein